MVAVAGLVHTPGAAEWSGRRGLWVLVALFGVNTLANVTGRHPAERWGAGGVTALLTVLLALLATR